VRVHRSYFLCNQPKLRRAVLVTFILECHRLERQNRLARFIHAPDLLFISARGRGRCGAKLTGACVDKNSRRTALVYPVDASDKRGGLARTDVDGIRFGGNTAVADIDIITTRRESAAGVKTQGGVFPAGAEMERSIPKGGVVVPHRVRHECIIPSGCVVGAAGIAEERSFTIGRVFKTGQIVKERLRPGGGIAETDGIELERLGAHCRVRIAHVDPYGGVTRKCLRAERRIVDAGGISSERVEPYGRVGGAGAVGRECVVAYCRVATSNAARKR